MWKITQLLCILVMFLYEPIKIFIARAFLGFASDRKHSRPSEGPISKHMYTAKSPHLLSESLLLNRVLGEFHKGLFHVAG